MSRFALVLVSLCLLGPAGGGAAAGEDDASTPLDRFFHGRITGLEKGVVTIRYDFATPGQLEDWQESLPFRVERLADQGLEFQEESLALRGNTGARHVAAWADPVRVTCRLVPAGDRDLGGLLVPGDASKDCAAFALVEHYFHGFDDSPGGQHTILKFGDRFKKRGAGADFTGFRYVARRPPPRPLVAGRSLTVAFGLRRSRLFLEVDGLDLQGKDIGVRLKAVHAGFYVLGGGVRVDDVEITGELDGKWLKAQAVALVLEKPIEKDDG